MNITEPFVLQNDVLLIPCAELSEDFRARISYDAGDYTLSRRHGRSASQVIDGETAALLALFRQPRTIVDAVIENSRVLGKKPDAWLDELLPHLGTFLQNHILVPAGSDEEQETRPRFESGARFAEWEIVRCVSLVEDSEIYYLRRDGGDEAALKIARMAMPFESSVFGNEATILRHLDGSGIAPKLFDAGLHEERPYLLMEWIAGVEATVAGAQRRHDRASLIELCASIARAYATLHAHGVLHSDVHPRNVVAGDGGRVVLLDFGLSRFIDQPPRVGRGGMYYFFEPEFLAANRQGTQMPSTEAGEQYALAAMLYLLIAGQHYLDFRYDRDEMARQAEADPPLPFAQRAIPPWPEVEQLLFRALEKDPARRHASVAELAERLASIREDVVRESLETPISAQARAFADETLRSFARGGAMFASGYAEAPTASINYGCAGAAAGLLRVAEARSDPALLALSAVWSSRAMTLIGNDDAYFNDAFELPREILGDVTPYHTESGLHAVAALIAAAKGEQFAQRRALGAFLDASNRPCAQLDLTLGRSGSLLACALLLEVSDGLPEADTLRAFGSATMAAIWNELDALPPLNVSASDTYLGIAHGWAGYLYAALRWCAVSGDALPERLRARLDEYVPLKTRKGRGVYWRRLFGGTPYDAMSGWCNGSAGQVFLFTLAHRVLGDDRWLELAELCAWHTWDEPRGPGDLCCGNAGRAYALLSLYKRTGSAAWLSRARQLANDAAAVAVASSQRKNTLWKGELGAAVLIADLASPENARMPFFE